MRRAEGGAQNFGVFRVKITILRQKIIFFPILVELKVLTDDALYSVEKPSYSSYLDHVSHILLLNILLKKEEIS